MPNFYRYMDSAGDGTGNKNFNGDYSSAAEQALLVAPYGTPYNVERLIVTIEDTSGMTAAEYGNLQGALTNGVEIKQYNENGVTLDITDGVPIKTNAAWAQLCYDVDLKTWGAGNEVLSVRFTFGKAGGPLRLSGDHNCYLAVELNDDFSGLVGHYFMLQGQTG